MAKRNESKGAHTLGEERRWSREEVEAAAREAIEASALPKGEYVVNQYEALGIDCTDRVGHDAVYRETAVAGQELNLLLRGIPGALVHCDEADEAREVEIPGYDHDKVRNLPFGARLEGLSSLSMYRRALPFQDEVAENVASAFASAYKDRELSVKSVSTAHGQEVELKTESRVLDDSAIGFALTGDPGTGKTNAARETLSHVPQLIRHHVAGARLSHVPWVAVPCAANGSIQTVYMSLACALDDAAGDDDHPTAAALDAAKGGLAGKKAVLVARLKALSVGLIVLDEVQMLNFKSNTKGSFDDLALVAQEAKCALMVIGTREAKRKMARESWVMRRLKLVDANRYCSDDVITGGIVEDIVGYQWTVSDLEVTDAAKAALAACPHGIAALIIQLWAHVQTDIIETEYQETLMGETPPEVRTVTRKMVEDCWRLHFSDLDAALNEDRTKDAGAALSALVGAGWNSLQGAIASLGLKASDEEFKQREEERRERERQKELHECVEWLGEFAPELDEGQREAIVLEAAEKPGAMGRALQNDALKAALALRDEVRGLEPPRPKRGRPKGSKTGSGKGKKKPPRETSQALRDCVV